MSTLTQLQVRPRVLCIDDDPAIVTALATRLRQYNVDVLSAFFGTQGIWLTVTARPDVIITDIRMPQGDGEYLVECLKGRTDTCDIPIIVLTGSRDCEIERWMMTLGVECYLHKPLRFEDLLDALTSLVDLQPVCSR